MRRLTLKQWLALAAAVLGLGVVAVLLYAVHLNGVIRERFAAPRKEAPLAVYVQPFVLARGEAVDTHELLRRLRSLAYVAEASGEGRPPRPGRFRLSEDGNKLLLEISPRPTGDGLVALFPARLEFELEDALPRLKRIQRTDTGRSEDLFSLEPSRIGYLRGAAEEVRERVTMRRIPPELLYAVVSIEDSRFLDHVGVDPKGILRAFFANLRSGRIVQGGSTITQQLVKNFFLTSEKTLSRKLAEAIMAVLLEANYNKDTILEAYLNEIYFGQSGGTSIHGAALAAKVYFGKRIEELTLSQAALLAGLIRGPGVYSPFAHPQKAMERRNAVLDRMLESGYIIRPEHQEAVKAPLGVLAPREGLVRAPYFMDYLSSELGQRYSMEQLAETGLHIVSTLDPELQALGERAVRDAAGALEGTYAHLRQAATPLQAALVALDPRTGRILATVGGRNYGQSQFNRAFQAKRQVGSLLKPLVFLAAFQEKTITPSSVYSDAPLTWAYEGQKWSPQNYDGIFRGPVTARRALIESINVPTVRIAKDVGLGPILGAAQGVGLAFPRLPSIALGTPELSPVEVAGMYAAFAGMGVYRRPHIWTRLVGMDGSVWDEADEGGVRAWDERTSFQVLTLLEDVLVHGTARYGKALGLGRPGVAGKTGTTDRFRDAWFAGFTQDLVAVAWVGFDDETPVKLSGSQAAFPIWAAFMREALKVRPPVAFDIPSGVNLVYLDAETGLRALSSCPDAVPVAFTAGTEPEEPCEKHGPGKPLDVKKGGRSLWERIF